MIRVGFLFEGGDAWLGGVNYLWNLLFAVGAKADRKLEPVLIAPQDAPLHGLDQITRVEIVRRQASPAPTVAARTMSRRVWGRDEVVARLCDQHRIDVLSHSGTFGWRMPVATTPWIPDLQHRRLPEFFSFSERRIRDYAVLHQLIEGDAVIVSSQAAANDCRRYYGPLASRLDVLRFVSQPRLDWASLPSTDSLRTELGVPERFFFLPNQFWRHKNHAVVVEAMAIAKRRGNDVQVVLTGKAADYRAPDHYRRLMDRVSGLGLSQQFQHLGLVPFPQLMGLVRDSIAVINPSLFEGWSTTVEESRSMGKATILSDIDVHREQALPDARYFAADDAESLAMILEENWNHAVTNRDEARRVAAHAALPARTLGFALRYEAIVERALSRRRLRR